MYCLFTAKVNYGKGLVERIFEKKNQEIIQNN